MELNDIKSLRISLASPQQIRDWSYGEVTKPETINYRRLRPEKDGLFCEAIFGPTKDWQCYCGKYKKVRFKGIKCDKCGVEVTHSRVRRERMGHIELATPIAHIWYTRRSPSYLGLLLNISQRNLDRVLYYAQYIITSIDENARDRSLHRLEEDISRDASRATKDLRDEIQALENTLKGSSEALAAKKAEVAEEIQRRRDEAIESVMTEATRLREVLQQYLDPSAERQRHLDEEETRLRGLLEECRDKDCPEDLVFKGASDRIIIVRQGETVRSKHVGTLKKTVQDEREALKKQVEVPQEDLVFKPSDSIIVRQGELVRREHVAAFSKVVQDALSQLDERLSMDKDRQLQVADHEETLATRKDKEHLGKLQVALDKQQQEIHLRIEQERDDLLSLKTRQLINETRYRELRDKWGRVFSAAMGAEAVFDIVSQINLENMAEELRHEIRSSHSKQRRTKAIKRLQIAEALRKSGNRPEWMIFKALPVIPPALRPMVQLDGGRFATSDLNDLYRRVVNRNNRLKHLIKLQAPEVIVRNEKRMLQEAVDSLIDNSRRGKAISLRGRRQLKSLSDMLKGKQGRFRRNLLGKRVDYSGRSVIVVGPHLKLHQCGLPKRMALELFRPFVMQKLVEYNHAINVKGAKRLIEREVPEVWGVLEEVIKTRPVLLNRAPTLHRLGIQAFEPMLVEGSAIQIHPLVCSAFNADFDGDQMAVHVPLSDAAVKEARELMLSSRNLLRPANGEPEVGPSKDMVLGCYYLTLEHPGMKGEGMAFSSFEEVDLAYHLGAIHVHAKIKLLFQPTKRHKPQIIDTTVGRVLFNAALPAELRFVNKELDKNGLKKLVAEGYKKLGLEGTAELVDAIKDIGFRYAMRSGTTIAIDDIHVPEDKHRILDEANERVAEVERQYRRGLITDNERYVKTVELWTEATEDVTAAVARELDPFGPLGIMVKSGATKGGIQPIRQLAGMRGLMADPSGRIIALPIRSNFREGLTSLEYFISTHGARKGLADTALRTADAGYLTRRLVDVAQDVIINIEDCGTTQGIWLTAHGAQEAGEGFAERIMGRYTAAPIVHPKTGEVMADANVLIGDDLSRAVEDAHISKAYVRSALSCSERHGCCVHCYGRDLGRGVDVKIGEAVGIVAAQSIGEPGTQLTLRTFHTGGVAGASDITQGLPRVQELFEARNPKGQAVIADMDGRIELRADGDQRWIKIVSSELKRIEHPMIEGYALQVEDGDNVGEGQLLASADGQEDILSRAKGRVSLEDGKVVVIHEEPRSREYEIPVTARLQVADGDTIAPGDMITEGSKNPHEILSILGVEDVREYMVVEIQKVYRSQGVSINDKHIEVIVRQMLRRVRVASGGDTELLPGQLVDRLELENLNHEVIERGGEPAAARPILLGITKAALNTDSFLSAAAFQHTISVLASAAIEGKVDELRGLKENVLIGKLIPAGTGFKTRDDEEVQACVRALASGLPERIIETAEEVIEPDLLSGGMLSNDLTEADRKETLGLDDLGAFDDSFLDEEESDGTGASDDDDDLHDGFDLAAEE